MEYRKLISFGKSSYVISLPKQWIRANKLEKGDTLFLNVESSEIGVYPGDTKPRKEEVEITIQTEDLSMEVIKRKLVSAYVNNADIIRLRGKGMKSKIRQVQNVVGSLVAMETIEQDTEKIILKSFLNTEEMNMNSLIRKADHVVSSMLTDIRRIPDSNAIESADLCDSINQRDEDVNRMCYLLFRTINRRVKQGKLNGDSKDLLSIWLFTYFLEEIGDEIKRVARVLKMFEDKTKLEKYKHIVQEYKDTYKKIMKAFYKDNKDLVYEVANTRQQFLEKCEEMQNEYLGDPLIGSLMDRTKSLVAKIYDLNRVSY